MADRSKLERGIIFTLLILSGVYLAFVYIPRHADSRIVGFVGFNEGHRFTVTTIYPESPAALSGLRVGDIVLSQNGVTTDQWRSWYESDVGTYLRERSQFRGKRITLNVLRENHPLTLALSVRALTAGEIVTFFGIRTFLIVLMLALTVYILVSKTRDKAAFLICLCFCFTVPWLASDEPFWPALFSPLIRSVGVPLVYFVDLLEAISLQLAIATLVHIALIFPQEHYLKQKIPHLPAVVYTTSLLIPAIAVLLSPGGLLERITELYAARLPLNTIFLVLVSLLIFSGYRQCRTPLQREKVRWIFVSVAIVAIVHLSLWNVPILVHGSPLVDNYNWVLLPLVLLPLSMTLSITNHELFGIRGIIRGRILLLNTLLQREKDLVVTRDQRIGELQAEIDQLKSSLEEYTVMEHGVEPESEADATTRLENRYPEIKAVREQRLLGVSDLWHGVFEQVVLAAQGSAPVLIVGESGTGKTDIASTVHRLSDRKDRPYKEISCAQFEHADPAFALGRLFGIGTGHGLPNAPRDGRPGMLEECDGGTLFLDDVDRLPLSVQDLLLYPMEGRQFEPGIGSGPPRSVSVKFIFAMNRNPEMLVAQGKMRSDVLARMRSRVDIPPLRQRPEDIPVLVDHFIDLVGAEIGHKISLISPKSMNILCRYPYSSGNARELKAEIEKAVGKAKLESDTVLRAGYLSERVRTATGNDEQTPPSVDRTGGGPGEAGLSASSLDVLVVLRKHGFQLKRAEAELGYSHKSKTLSHHLRGICTAALSEQDWDLDRAALALAGEGGPRVVTKLKGKMRRFLHSIEENIARQTDKRLYKNLPAAYHGAMDRTIDHVRQSRSRPRKSKNAISAQPTR